ncbi:MAG: superoxide dismutase family protein [Clostridia bacterium]|nr:superoxide dismutase family protein [Clostridia bacterium]
MNNEVLVRAEIVCLPTNKDLCESPVFAFHIHEGKACGSLCGDEPFKDAGAHFNPCDCPHPYHKGDLPPLFGANGKAFSMFLTDRFKVADTIGKTVVIHKNSDDFTTQPSGNSGERIACGVIMPLMRAN